MKILIYLMVAAVAAAFSLAGCSTIPKIPSQDPHPHIVPYAVSLGERHFHAAMEYDQGQGEITIRFLEANEKPYRTFKADRAKAVLIVAGEPEREFYLNNDRRDGLHTFPSGRFQRDNYTYTDHIEAQNAFFKNVSAFQLKTWLPVDGVVYEVTFVYPHQQNGS